MAKSKLILEYGPTVAFVVVYLIFRNDTFVIEGAQYSGLVAVIAGFLPIFAIAIGLLWWITGRPAPIQIATAVMVLVFGGLSVWLNDARLFKMKPTAIYMAIALILWAGFLRKRYWLRHIIVDLLPLKTKGWRILTRRVIMLCVMSAVANEIIWRTQSEAVWLIFETFAMPVIVVVFFLCQISLFVDYVAKAPTGRSRLKTHAHAKNDV